MNKLSNGKVRILIVLLIAVLALAGVFYLFREAKGPFHALPSQAALVLEFNSLAKATLLKKSLAAPWQDLFETEMARHAWGDAAMAEGLLRHDAGLQKAFGTQRLLLALTLNRADSLHGLFILQLHDDLDLPGVLAGNTLTKKVFPSLFHGHTLYTAHMGKQERLVVAKAGQLLIFSRFSYLVEDALMQLEGSDRWWAERKQGPASGEGAPFRVLLRPSAAATQYENSMAEGWGHVPTVLAANVEWFCLAWNGRELTACAETGGFLRNIGWWGKPATGNMPTVLPDNTALFARAVFDRPRLFFDQIKRGASSDFDRYVLPWAGSEAAWVLTEPFSPGMRDDQFIVVSVRDSSAALEHLRSFGRDRGALHVGDYQTFEVFEFMSQSLLAPLLGESRWFHNPACSMVGGYVVFANTRSALELWIDKYVVSQTLAQNTDFLQLQQKNSGAEANAQIFLHANYLPLLLKNLLDPARSMPDAADIAAFSRIGMLDMQLISAGGKNLEIKMAAQSAGAAPVAASILWKTPLVSTAATQPFVLKSGESTAILIQDTRNELYRLDPGGTVVWRRQMEEPLMGAVRHVDFWGNGTPFYLFNTARHIWLLDDEGRDVQGFPLDLQSPATNGVVAIDFDKTLKYNYFIACANGNIYGYDQFGRPLPGWNPQAGTGRVTQPLAHLQSGGKDYLAVINQGGKMFVFARNGAERFPPVPWSGKSFGPIQVDASAKPPRFVCADNTGMLHVCKPDGSTFSMAPGKGSGKGNFALFPAGGNSRNVYAVAKGAGLVASAYEGAALKTVYSTQLPAPPDTIFAAGDQKLGALHRDKRRIYLFDGKGMAADFPLAGTTPFVVHTFSDKQGPVLLVGDGSSVYAYKIR